METIIEKVYVEVPTSDLELFKALAQRIGWNIKTREELVERYIRTYREMADLSEEDMEEIKS